MKFLDLHAQYQSIKKEVDRAIASVLHDSAFIMGRQVAELEEAIAEYIGTKYAVGLNSGSDALTASLISLGIGKGDEVILPSFTYIATAEAVAISGATIVFADIDPKTFNIDTENLSSIITKKTKAIIPVHLYGLPANMDEILNLAKLNDLFVVEDAAQAIGAEYKGHRVGSLGNVGCLSFFPTKNLGAYGDGGMLVTDNKEIVDVIKKWRIHGQTKKYYTDFVGASSRLDTLQAAILLAKLPHLDSWKEARQEIANFYSKELGSLPVETPITPPDSTHVFHQYTIRIPNIRDVVQSKLKKSDIPTMIYYPQPLHQQKPYITGNTLVESELASKEVLSLPIYPELVSDDMQKVILGLKAILS